jgi:hypothetical protein
MITISHCSAALHLDFPIHLPLPLARDLLASEIDERQVREVVLAGLENLVSKISEKKIDESQPKTL